MAQTPVPGFESLRLRSLHGFPALRHACAKNWLNSKTNLNRLPAFLLPNVFHSRVFPTFPILRGKRFSRSYYRHCGKREKSF